MIAFPAGARVWIAGGVTDMRCGMNSLALKVQQGPGRDVNGADILVRATTTEEFAEASSRYFDNDAGRFAPPHADASDPVKVAAVVQAIEMAITV
ncbi:hypothetical protein [Oceanibium sediminis]|uniref:hypothetical protein n=1 Tax=Oceanibium sediminis TaxID=2026339 RepID=UPI0018E4FDC9